MISPSLPGNRGVDPQWGHRRCGAREQKEVEEIDD